MKFKTYFYKFADINEIRLNSTCTHQVYVRGQYKMFITPEMYGHHGFLVVSETMIDDDDIKKDVSHKFELNGEKTIEIKIGKGVEYIFLKLTDYYGTDDLKFNYVVLGCPDKLFAQDNQYIRLPDKYQKLYYML